MVDARGLSVSTLITSSFLLVAVFTSLIETTTCESASSSPPPQSKHNNARSKASLMSCFGKSPSTPFKDKDCNNGTFSPTTLPPPTATAATAATTATTATTANAIRSFQKDMHKLDTQPKTDLTTPCIIICRDTTYTRMWTLQDWKDHSKKALIRYSKHIFSWPTSTTMHNILSAVAVSCTWSFIISYLATKYLEFKTILTKFTITLSFLQAPILLLLTLRTNRALDRLLESRKAWGALNRATRTLMGLVCAHVLPKNPKAACIIARYLAIFGWALKGTLRNEQDSDLIQTVMSSEPQEAEWLLKQCNVHNVRTPHALVHRLRNILSTLGQDVNNGGIGISPIILFRMEELLYDIEGTVGICNRVAVSPIPPTYTRHTSRVLVMYLGMLPVALIGMGINTLAIIVTVAFASYILIGIDEIGLEIEHPFPIMPLYGMSLGIQKEVERQVMMMDDMPTI